MRPKRKVPLSVAVARGEGGLLRDLGDEVSCLLQEGGCEARGIEHVVHVSSLNVTNTLLVPALLLLPLQYTHPWSVQECL